MCCTESNTNRITVVESTGNNIEIRKGRWLRIIYQHPDSFLRSTNVLKNAVHSPVIQVNSWLENGIDSESAKAGEDKSNKRTNKIVIFFIHGVGGCSDIWNEQIEYFSKLGYVVVAPDMLGHGGSTAPRDESNYTFTELAYDMFAVFDRYRSEKKNILVGHSYG